MERTLHFRENLLTFWGIWGEAELILRIWGAKENIFRELRYFLSGIWGDKCIIFRDQGSKDPPGASDLINVICGKNFCQGHWLNCSNFCIKYINVCQESIRLFFFFVKRYHISLTMKVHQVHHPQNHMSYMYILYFMNEEAHGRMAFRPLMMSQSATPHKLLNDL